VVFAVVATAVALQGVCGVTMEFGVTGMVRGP
jgi:hypothetical protein